MFIPKWLLNNILRQLEDKERRIKRLETTRLQQLQRKEELLQKELENIKKEIADFGNTETSNPEKYLTIEEIVKKGF